MKVRYIGHFDFVVTVFALACAGIVILSWRHPGQVLLNNTGNPPPTFVFSAPMFPVAPPAFPTNAMVRTLEAAKILKDDFNAIMRLVVNRVQPNPVPRTNEPGDGNHQFLTGIIEDTNVSWFYLVSPEAVTLMTDTDGPGAWNLSRYDFVKTNGQWSFTGGGRRSRAYY